jgi:hypothetical protein
VIRILRSSWFGMGAIEGTLKQAVAERILANDSSHPLRQMIEVG